MGKVILIARILLGLVFFVFGLNGFFGFLPPPEVPEGAAGAYMAGLAGTGYFFPVLKLTEVVAGALLLAGLWVPLALVLLAPVVVQIVLYHLFLDPSGQGLGTAIVILVLQLLLAWAYRGSFGSVLERGARPTSSARP